MRLQDVNLTVLLEEVRAEQVGWNNANKEVGRSKPSEVEQITVCVLHAIGNILYRLQQRDEPRRLLP
jgi:hypothetical protein